MRDTRGSDLPRSNPTALRHLLEAADGPDCERAWGEFLDAYSRLILYVARRVPRDHDGVMDRYVFVIEHLREKRCRRLRAFAVEGRGKFTTWLVVVVRRLCLDHDRRRLGRAPKGTPDAVVPRRLIELAFDPDVLEQVPDGAPLPDDELERRQTLEQLHAALERLSPSDRLLLTLRYQDDRSAREIASLMSLPTPFHVYRRLTRVHASLREALGASSPGASSSRAASVLAAVSYRWKGSGPLEPIP
jgi:RNA polymerase sigma-70 factor (ECF subfamily)